MSEPVLTVTICRGDGDGVNLYPLRLTESGPERLRLTVEGEGSFELGEHEAGRLAKAIMDWREANLVDDGDDSCRHHWHVNWFDKFQEVIQCCHCGETLEQGCYSFRNRDEGCGSSVRSRVSFTPPVHSYVIPLMECVSCDGDGSVMEANGDRHECVACDGKGLVEP